MDGSGQWHTMCTKLNLCTFYSTDILPQHKLFLCGYAVLKTEQCGISLTVDRIEIELHTSLMSFKTFSTVQWSSIYD